MNDVRFYSTRSDSGNDNYNKNTVADVSEEKYLAIFLIFIDNSCWVASPYGISFLPKIRAVSFR